MPVETIKSNSKKSRHLFLVLLFFVCLSFIFFHILLLGQIPRGLFCDESSVGYNAGLIAKTGYDEHQKFFPLYFKSFKGLGDLVLTDPLYIYSAALLFRFTAPSEFKLRFISFFFYILFILGLYLFIKEFFKKNRLIIIYSLASAGFLPWFFCLSRISFPVISQLPALIFLLYFLYRTCKQSGEKNNLLLPVLAGIFAGFWTYAYGTARLSAVFMLLSFAIFYFSRKNIKKIIAVFASFLITLIPCFIYSFQNPGALTARFKWLSYIYNPSISLGGKFSIFIENYFSYFSPHYLILSGDSNYRHNIGSGEIFIAVFILFLAGLIYLIRKNLVYFRQNKFAVFLFLNMLFCPVSAALTQAEHSLRSVTLGVYIIIFSCFGLLLISEFKNKIFKNLLIALVFISLIIESLLFLKNYFFIYPEKSINAFENYGFKEALSTAINRKPGAIIVSDNPYGEYAYLEFYKMSKNYDPSVHITISPPSAQKDTCIIYFPSYKDLYNPKNLPEKYQNSNKNYARLKCF